MLKIIVVWIFCLISYPTFSKPTVLLTYFTPFGINLENNSKHIALEISLSLKHHFEFILCEIPTSFNRSFSAWESCYNKISKKADIHLSLGERGCGVNFEMYSYNKKLSNVVDNDGEFHQGKIIPNAPKTLGMTYPLEEIYCEQNAKDRPNLLSRDIGFYVCNNLSYNILYNYPEISYGFVHVPKYDCATKEAQNTKALRVIESLLNSWAQNISHSSSLPIKKSDAPTSWRNDECLKTIYSKLK